MFFEVRIYFSGYRLEHIFSTKQKAKKFINEVYKDCRKHSIPTGLSKIKTYSSWELQKECYKSNILFSDLTID